MIPKTLKKQRAFSQHTEQEDANLFPPPPSPRHTAQWLGRVGKIDKAHKHGKTGQTRCSKKVTLLKVINLSKKGSVNCYFHCKFLNFFDTLL